MKQNAILFDIGGTKTRVALATDGKSFGEPVTFHTPSDPKLGTGELVTAIQTLVGEGSVARIIGGIRGVLNEHKTGIQYDATLSQWVHFDLVKALQTTYDVPIQLVNDTALAGLGEATYGAGEGIDLVVYHTISTGVGGVRIDHGQIDAASNGFEPGHQVLDIDRTILGDEIVPTLENLVSGSALEARVGSKPYDIPQSDVIWEELAGYLAQGLRNTILYWSPDTIILGGSMMIGDPKIPLESVRRATVEVLGGFVPCPFITTAKLGDEAGLYGALAILASTKH
jgi:predicted NBD/HSP70 family sugar kinase